MLRNDRRGERVARERRAALRAQRPTRTHQPDSDSRPRSRIVTRSPDVYQADGDLAMRTRDGDDRAFEELALRYRLMLGQIAGCHKVDCLPREDMHQAALLGLWDACEIYDGAHEQPFSHLVATCAKKRVLHLIRDHLALKHKLLTYARSFAEPVPTYTGLNADGLNAEWIADRLPSTYTCDPYEIVAAREELFAFRRAKLTQTEEQAVVRCMLGWDVDNAGRCALVRARRRIRAHLGEPVSAPPPDRGKHGKIGNDTRARAVRLVEGGASLAAAARAVGVGRTSVQRWMGVAA